MITILQNNDLVSYFNFSEVGDTVILSQDFFLGVNSIVSFTEEVDFDDINSNFEKYCSYTVDGINWSNWENLTNELLSKINVKNNFPFSIKYKYIRVGNVVGNAKLYSVSLNIEYSEIEEPHFYKQTFYSRFFPFINTNSISWSTNLIEKVFKKGIVPDFIKRGENINWEDENYLNFWFPLIYFLSFPYVWDLYLKDFYFDKTLLRKYLEQRGLILSKDSDLLELNFVLKYQYEEILKRGGRDIFNINQIIDGSVISGEFIRLINQSSQYLSTLGVISDRESGLTVGETYFTYTKNSYLNFSIPFVLNLTGPIYITQGVITEEGRNYNSYKINTESLEEFAGIDSDFRFISPECNYLISFKIKGAGKLTFGVITQKSDGEIVDCFDSETESNLENNFLTEYEFNNSEGLFIEGLVVNSDNPVQEPASKYLGLKYLRLNESAYKLSFFISISCETEVVLYDIDTQLLPVSYNHSYLLPVSELLIKLEETSLIKPIREIKREAEEKLFPISLYWGEYDVLLPNVIIPENFVIGEGFPYIIPVTLGLVSTPPAPVIITVETSNITNVTDFTATSGGTVSSTEESVLLSGSTNYINAEVGDIILSDKSFVPLTIYNGGGYLPAIGIVVDNTSNNLRVIALSKSSGIQWDSASTPMDLSLTNYSDGDSALSDFNGLSNSSVILAALGSSPSLAAGYCYNYNTQGTNIGDWYFPATGEVNLILSNVTSINSSLLDVGNFTLKINSNSDFENNTAEIYWSSSENNYKDAFLLYLQEPTTIYINNIDKNSLSPLYGAYLVVTPILKIIY